MISRNDIHKQDGQARVGLQVDVVSWVEIKLVCQNCCNPKLLAFSLRSAENVVRRPLLSFRSFRRQAIAFYRPLSACAKGAPSGPCRLFRS